jgi:hypothetical protein
MIHPMTLSEEIQKLEKLHRNGTLSPEEFEIAKHRVLEGSSAESDHLEEIKTQNELAQVDREWRMERENYMVWGRYGHRYIPSKVSSVVWGIFVVGFGLYWTSIATSLVGFGILFILFAASTSIWAFVKSGQYEEAQAKYQRRRHAILNKSRKT